MSDWYVWWRSEADHLPCVLLAPGAGSSCPWLCQRPGQPPRVPALQLPQGAATNLLLSGGVCHWSHPPLQVRGQSTGERTQRDFCFQKWSHFNKWSVFCRSKRKGYLHYAMGQLRQMGKQFYDTDIHVEVLSEQMVGDYSHVTMRWVQRKLWGNNCEICPKNSSSLIRSTHPQNILWPLGVCNGSELDQLHFGKLQQKLR